jgi:protein-tyrosine phosphatase
VVAGYRVVLAHPERSVTFREEPRRLRALLGHDILAQVNAGSILEPRRDRGHHAAAVAMVREGLATVVASDTHSAGPWRPPLLPEAVAVLERMLGGWVRWLVTDAPAAILAGDELPSRPAVRAARLRLRASRH